MVFQVPEKYLGGRGENQESWNYQKNSFIDVALMHTTSYLVMITGNPCSTP